MNLNMSCDIETAFLGKTIKTGVICFADGTVFYGIGFGAEKAVVGEVCFNTSITGYQEILSDPSYAQQIVTFTFPHIGNVGTNPEDIEAETIYASGFIVRESVANPSNWRATNHLVRWAEKHHLVGISNIDTRALTGFIRDKGMPNAVIAYAKNGDFNIPSLVQMAQEWSGLIGKDLAKEVSTKENYTNTLKQNSFKVVAIDYGIKANILKCLSHVGCQVTVVPAKTSFDDIMALNPDGIFLSNGPADPAATADYAVPIIQKLLNTNLPIFGICMGHQLLGLAVGAKTEKMKFGHHGANHPVKNLTTDKVEITSMNHGFTIMRDTLPTDVEQTHVSLFDGSNCGIALKKRPVFSVQYHPEASPGPQDSYYLFQQFADFMRVSQNKKV
jgi:carbamoyl-phosphate synthase small subunit